MFRPLTCGRPACALVLLLAASGASAQDMREPHGMRTMALAAAAASHVGDSPFSPPEEEDTVFVVDQGSGLDTGCSYRSNGPLQIHLLIKRVVGPVGGDGRLADPGGMVSRGLVSARIKLLFPAYDIDVHGGEGVPPEVDRISFNGHPLGTLTGDDGIWKLNQFDVPIEHVKFAAQGAPGSAPTPGDNLIQIDIDTASAPDENWCMAIDWANAEFSAMAPVFLVHGTNAQSDTWDPDFTAFFRASRAPWSNDINLTANGAILGNGRLLADRVTALATSFGAKKAHIIAHSKGGLDTRAYLNNHYDKERVEILSVHTLSTPHRGTIISDIIVAKRAATNPESSHADIKYLIEHDYSFVSSPQPPAINNQSTTAMAVFNANYPAIPSGIRFYNYGADADLNNNGRIEASETAPLIPGIVPDSMAAAAGNALYRALGSIGAIRVTVGTRPGRLWGTNTFTDISVATATPFQQNDLVVTDASARAPGGTYLRTLNANHSSMKSQALAQEIFNRIKADFPLR